MRTLYTSVAICAAIVGSSFDASAIAATLDSIQGTVQVNSGAGFHKVAGAAQVAPGASVMAAPGASAQILYSDGCRIPVTPGAVAVGGAGLTLRAGAGLRIRLRHLAGIWAGFGSGNWHRCRHLERSPWQQQSNCCGECSCKPLTTARVVKSHLIWVRPLICRTIFLLRTRQAGAANRELKLHRFRGHPTGWVFGVHNGKKHPPYAPEFRRQMIELVRAGRTPEELAKEFEPTAQAMPELARAGGCAGQGAAEDGQQPRTGNQPSSA